MLLTAILAHTIRSQALHARRIYQGSPSSGQERNDRQREAVKMLKARGFIIKDDPLPA